MYEKFLDLTKQEVYEFTPIEGFEYLPELTARNLWDLCDLSIRFGILDFDIFAKPGVFFRYKNLSIEVYNFKGNEMNGLAGFFVGKNRPEETIQSTKDGAVFLKLLNQMTVIWDRGFSPTKIQSMIYEIDELA